MYMDVALYGKSGTGKSTVAGLLAAAGFQHLRTGAACRRITRDLFDSESKALTNQVTDALRHLDELVWIKRALRERDERPAVLDSMRFGVDYDFCVARGFTPVKIISPRPTRIRRLADRGQIFDEAVDDLHATENDLENHSFAYELKNAGDLMALEESTRDLLASLHL